MIKTKIKKIAALAAIAAMGVATFGNSVSAATNIGTGSVVGSGAFDAAIVWDDAFPGFATGSVANIKIKARVLPTLNMSISAAEIDLGDLTPSVASTGSLFLEVGTNAKAGVVITARSTETGLKNTVDALAIINQDVADGVTGEAYSYSSTPAAVDDSSIGAFVATGLTSTPVDDNTTEHVVYSTNKSEATNLVDDVEFIVSATAGAETPAGEYEDTVTFTVVGSF